MCDLNDAGQTRQTVERVRPDAVIHSQALADVDLCERDPALAMTQNTQTVAHLAAALAGTHTPLVYISTDYVFDGTKGTPYDEDDAPNPLCVYGRSKLEGERLTLHYPHGVVARPSTLFGAGRNNFCDFIVRTALEGAGVIEAFTDQTTSPTYTDDVAVALGALLSQQQPAGGPRIYHTANEGGCTRLAFVHRVVDLLKRSRHCVRPTQMAQQRRPAARPAYSALTSKYVPAPIRRILRPWDEALEAYLRQRRWLT